MSVDKSLFLENIGLFANPYYSLVVLCMTFLAAVVALYVHFQRVIEPKDPKKYIPGPKVHPITAQVVPLGAAYRNTTASFSALFFQTFCGYTKVFQKEGLFRIWAGLRPIIVLCNPDAVETLLNSAVLLDKSSEYDFLAPWLKEGLLRSSGSKWRKRRKLLTPAFHFRILDEFLPVFNEQAQIFVDKMSEMMETQPWVDIAPEVSLCTLDIICETAMGKPLGAQRDRNNVYVKSLHKLCEAFIVRLLSPWLWTDFVYYKTYYGKQFRSSLDLMDKFTRDVIKEKKAEMLEYVNKEKNGEIYEEMSGKKKRRALLDLLLNLHLNDEKEFTLDDIAEEVDNFMFAGHDTTSSGLSWTLYMVALHPKVQKKVQEEVDSIFGCDTERPVTDDDIKNLKYVECVLKEGRRLFPPTPFFGRKLCEDTVINGYKIPKGTTCGVFAHMLHRHDDYFPNPEYFDPDRFLPENCVGRHPFAYVPFSAGSRNCIGQRFAFLEAKVIMASIMRNFNLRAINPLDKVFMVAEVVLRAENGLKVAFTKRKEWGDIKEDDLCASN